jgi:hypothetical protein
MPPNPQMSAEHSSIPGKTMASATRKHVDLHFDNDNSAGFNNLGRTQRQQCISDFSWSTYLISDVLWLWYGLRKRDRNIYFPCIGWITLDPQ